MAFEFRRVAAALLVAALPAVLASCSPAARDPSINAGANRAEVYPDITAIVTAETQQMSDEEAAANGARLTALANRRSSGAISDAEYRRQLAELQSLREGHGKATLAEIEGQK